MNILALSDVHADFDAFCPGDMPEADLVLFAGDLTNMGINEDPGTMALAERWLREMAAKYPQIFAIPGNHDIGFQTNTMPEIPHVRWIQDSTVIPTADPSVTIHGVNLSPSYLMPELVSKFDFMTADHAVEDTAFDFEPVTIVLSHAPPFGILDVEGSNLDTGEPMHIGSEALLRYIDLNHPQLVVCGHVHAAPGLKQIEAAGCTTVVHNVARTYRIISI